MSNLALISCRIPAIHATPRQIDHDVGAIDALGPLVQLKCVPGDYRPFLLPQVPRDDSYIVPLFMEMARQNVAKVPGSSGNHNTQPA